MREDNVKIGLSVLKSEHSVCRIVGVGGNCNDDEDDNDDDDDDGDDDDDQRLALTLATP
jgi:hypothetical protein